MCKLLTSYLSDRHICVKINGKISSLRLLYHEEPQRSILLPLPFLLYINNLPNASNFKTTFLLTIQIFIYLTIALILYNLVFNKN